MATANNLTLLRQLLSELRISAPKNKIKDSLVTQYILNQFRKYKTTDQQLCKAQEEVKYLADNYLCYLRSGRVYKEINEQYKGKGERTVAETAKMVGFKLPHDPK